MGIKNGPILGIDFSGGNPLLFHLFLVLFILGMWAHIKYFRNFMTPLDYIRHYIWLHKRKRNAKT